MGQSDFESTLPDELVSAVSGLTDSDFASSSQFEDAVAAVVGSETFIQTFPVDGKKCAACFEKNSRSALAASSSPRSTSFVDETTLDGYQSQLVNEGLNINAQLVFHGDHWLYRRLLRSPWAPVMWAMFSEIFSESTARAGHFGCRLLQTHWSVMRSSKCFRGNCLH
jgi:hypothetical protein